VVAALEHKHETRDYPHRLSTKAHLWLRRSVVMLAMVAACGPQSIDRVSPTDGIPDGSGDGLTPGTGGAGGNGSGTGGNGGGTGGSDASDGAGGAAPPPDVAAEVASPDLQPDRGPDLPPDGPVPDLAPEVPAVRTVLLVLGGNPTTAEARLRTTLMGRGFMVKVVQDDAAVDVTGVHLVIIAETCTSATLTTKYREVAVPVINLEPAVMDDMGLTGPTSGEHYEQNEGTMITIVSPLHPMAAGTTGTVTPVTGGSGAFLVWGVPADSAEKVATLFGMPNRFTIFGYPTGAMMVGQVAPARRVGFFAGNTSLERLNDNGIKLMNAAIDWALLP
jgi:hypothetical protein